MGKRTSAERDQAKAVIAGSISATGATPSVELYGWFNASVSGGNAAARLERSFDGGTTWHALMQGQSIIVVSLNAVGQGSASISMFEPELGVLYRFNCTTYTSGPTAYRLSQ